jgi:hypothetical protein
MTTVETTVLRMFERNIARKIYGYMKEGERGIRINKEMKDVIQMEDIYEIPPTKVVWSC